MSRVIKTGEFSHSDLDPRDREPLSDGLKQLTESVHRSAMSCVTHSIENERTKKLPLPTELMTSILSAAQIAQSLVTLLKLDSAYSTPMLGICALTCQACADVCSDKEKTTALDSKLSQQLAGFVLTCRACARACESHYELLIN
jgi:hypothetical protein